MQSCNIEHHNKKEIFLNIYWAIGGKIVNLFSVLITGIFIARYLGPEKYGILQYIISYVTIFNVIANFGLPNINIRELSKNNVNKDKIIGTSVKLRLYLACITTILIAGTLFVTENDTETIVLILIYSFSIFANALMPLQNFFTAKLRNKIIIKAEILRAIVGSTLKIVLVIIKAPLLIFVIVFAFDFFIFFSSLFNVYKQNNKVSLWKFDYAYAKYLLKESFPLLLSGIAIVIYNEVDKLMIRNMLTDADVGHYAVAGKIVVLILFIPQIIAQTITPVLVREREGGNYKKIRQMFMDYMVWGAMVGSLAICLASSLIIKTLYGDAYLAAIPVLSVLAWKGLLSSLWQSSGHIIIVENLQKYAVLRNLTGALINVILNLFFIPRYGILGAAWATLISLSFAGIFSHIFIKPYHYLFKLELNAVFLGLFRIYHRLSQTIIR